MLGLIVQLAISWLIIWLYERNDLRVLGFYPTKARLKAFVVFFLVTAACCTTGFLLKMWLGGQRWELNPVLSVSLVLEGIWWNIKSVLFEELIFRGVLFYILIKKLGAIQAIIISSVAFGIYHWFSFGVIGNPVAMTGVFLITGTMGLVYAYGYAKTMSLYIPCAIHLGWNITQGFIFSEGSIGNGVLKHVSDAPFRTESYVVFYVVFLVPMLSAMAINYILLRRKVQVKHG
jgi:membrane protease YdiL (CAAX protease family)